MKTPPLITGGWALDKKGGPTQYNSNNHTKYKLDAARFENMWVKQNGCCILCGITFAHPTKRSGMGVKCYVDHRHMKVEPIGSITFDRVRGLLCFNCNHLLGDMHEDLEWLNNAQQYLKQHGISETDYLIAEHGKAKEQRFDEIEVQNADGTVELIRRYYD